MKKIKYVLLLVFIVLVSQTSLYAQADFKIKLPDYKFTVDDEPLLNFPFLSINGEYYLPVTEMASFFGLHTEIDKKKLHVISLLPENSKDAEESEQRMFQFTQNINRKVQASKYQIVYKGAPMKAVVLSVDGCSFIKLEDAAKFFGIYVYRDDKEKVVNISTSRDVFGEMSKEQRTVYEEYLTKNVMPMDINNLTNRAFIEESGLDKYNIFLLGENHGIAKNFTVDLFFIKYLSQNQGLRYILTENGYCDAQLLNRYLKTGDMSVLENMMNNLKGTFAYSEEMYQFYKNIYEYNKTLSEDKKLEFIGIDIQHQTDTGMDYLMSLLPKTEIPEAIKKDLDTFMLIKKEKNYKLEVLQPILKSLDEHKTVYQEYLGKEYEHFRFGLVNVIQRLECKSGSEDEFMRLREKKMIENFINQYSKTNQAKCFGMLGGAHTSLNTYLDSEKKEWNIANYMNSQYEQTKGKVASISLMYFNSYYMDSQTGKSTKVYAGTLQKILADTTTSDYTLYPLNRDNSIFLQDGSTASQQYLLLIKNSPAATAYGKK